MPGGLRAQFVRLPPLRGAFEFGGVARGELAAALLRRLVEPFPQLVGRGRVLGPAVQRGALLADPPRPQPVDEDAQPVLRRPGVVYALHPAPTGPASTSATP